MEVVAINERIRAHGMLTLIHEGGRSACGMLMLIHAGGRSARGNLVDSREE